MQAPITEADTNTIIASHRNTQSRTSYTAPSAPTIPATETLPAPPQIDTNTIVASQVSSHSQRRYNAPTHSSTLTRQEQDENASKSPWNLPMPLDPMGQMSLSQQHSLLRGAFAGAHWVQWHWHIPW